MSQSNQSGCGCGNAGTAQQMPHVTFSTFILSLASSALVQLGEVPDPDTGLSSGNLARVG